MKTRNQLIKEATNIAERVFDKQMLDLVEDIKQYKKLHMQHRYMLLEYCEAHKK